MILSEHLLFSKVIIYCFRFYCIYHTFKTGVPHLAIATYTYVYRTALKTDFPSPFKLFTLFRLTESLLIDSRETPILESGAPTNKHLQNCENTATPPSSSSPRQQLQQRRQQQQVHNAQQRQQQLPTTELPQPQSHAVDNGYYRGSPCEAADVPSINHHQLIQQQPVTIENPQNLTHRQVRGNIAHPIGFPAQMGSTFVGGGGVGGYGQKEDSRSNLLDCDAMVGDMDTPNIKINPNYFQEM